MIICTGFWESGSVPTILASLRIQRAQLALHTRSQISARIKSFRYGLSAWGSLAPSYRMNALACANDVWQMAIDELLNDSDVVLMDLSGYTRNHRGCSYEIHELLSRVPTERFLLKVDTKTDLEYLQSILNTEWERMAPRSPNRAESAGPVRVFVAPFEWGDSDPE